MGAPLKRLSCDRCHSQKLRCQRQNSNDDESCYRCLRQSVQCVYSEALPKGRPRTSLNPPTATASTRTSIPRITKIGATVTSRANPRSLSSPPLSTSPEPTCDYNHNDEAYKDAANDADAKARHHQQRFSGSEIQSQQETWIEHYPIEVFTAFPHQESPETEPSTFFNRGPFNGNGDTAMTMSELTSQGLNSSSLSQSQPEGRGWSDALAAIRPEGNISGLPQPQVSLQDTLQYVRLGDESDLPSTDYMASDNASRPRYIESAFWALLHGQEPLCDKFLESIHSSSKTAKAVWHIDAAGLASLLKAIPTKEVCDALLYSFQISILPVHHIIHLPTFRKDYNAFWRWYKHSDASAPDRLIDDPTFVPLFFSVLFCGSATAPVGFWLGARPLAGLDIGSTVTQLRNSYLKSLECCQYMRRPTLNTLVASFLGRSCAIPEYPQFLNGTKVSEANHDSSIMASPAGASFSQHASIDSPFSLNDQQTSQTSSSFGSNDMSLGFDLGSIFPYLESVDGGQAAPSEPGMAGLDIPDLGLWPSTILQSSEDLPSVSGDFQPMRPWR